MYREDDFLHKVQIWKLEGGRQAGEGDSTRRIEMFGGGEERECSLFIGHSPCDTPTLSLCPGTARHK